MDSLDTLIKQYFEVGLQQKEILSFLRGKHNVFISPRTLKRHLYRLGLVRRKFSCLEHVYAFIISQITTSAQLHGYRWMHLKCIQQGLVVSQNVVRQILLENELDGICFQRNTHKIRRSRNAIAPSGRPIAMFELPEHYGYSNYLVKIPTHAINILKADAEVTTEVIFCDTDVESICICIMTENGWTKDGSINNAVSLYGNLRNKILNLLQQI
ncbi:hypothetical protein NQ315_016201 [Exocentrus adspersus]|uniref:Transposase n=1 Tax=Exocentrus adspersus TaxID=1586481 RepID=A0AAV8VJ36_9CUCU|nr:hypothetical protein NQ315_016201 [Exocentrus adspersus]